VIVYEYFKCKPMAILNISLRQSLCFIHHLPQVGTFQYRTAWLCNALDFSNF